MSKTGSCLCGKVRFTADAIPSLQACHCRTCRKWGGGPFIAVPCKSAEFEGEVTRFAASKRADRGFCPTCGTHLFFYSKPGDMYGIPAGLFDEDPESSLRAEYFIDEKPDYYCFSEETKKLTGAEFHAKFG